MNEERRKKLGKLNRKHSMMVVTDGDVFVEALAEQVKELKDALGYQLDFSGLDMLVEELGNMKSLSYEVGKLKEAIKEVSLPENIKVSGLDSIVAAIQKIKLDQPQVKVEWLNEKALGQITEHLEQITKAVKASVVEPSKAPSDFIPFRRVIKLGNKLVFDDSLWGGSGGGGGIPEELIDRSGANPVVRVSSSGSSGGGDGAILDGSSSSIKATVFDYANANPLAVVLRDESGDYVSVGGGTQYTEDAAAAANPIGTALNLIRADSLAGVTTADGDNLAARGTDKGELYVKHADSIAITHAALTELAAAINASSQVDVNIASGNITGFATSAKQDTIIGHLDGLETLLTDIEADTDTLAVVGGGLEATALRVTIASDSTGVLSVDDNGGSLTVDNAGLTELAAAINASSQMDINIAASGATVPISHAALTELAAAIDTEVQVDVVGALPAGTNNIGDVDIASIAAGDNNIGNVDIVTVPADPFGANADAAATAGGTGSIQAKLRNLTSTNDAIKTAVEILDNAISGSEMQVDVVGALPAGTNAIGKLLPPDVDVTTHTNYAKKYYTNSGAVTDGIVWSPAAGKRWHVVSMYIQVSADATVTLEDDLAAGDSAVWKGELAGKSGVTINFGEKYPLASGEDAADLIITTSAGNVYVTVTGYEI